VVVSSTGIMKGVRHLVSLTLVVFLVTSLVACVPTASVPVSTPSATSPTQTSSPSAAPSITASTIPVPARITVSDSPITSSAGAFLLFQLPGETRLRAITFDGAVSGTLPGQVPANAFWLQSAYGAPYLVDSTIYDRDARSLGTIPWSVPTVSPAWSTEGTSLCAAVPEGPTTRSAMRLEQFTLGQQPRVIGTGFTNYSDNAGFPVLVCDSTTDRIITAVFGQGVAFARLWVFRLSNGSLVRAAERPAGVVGAWVAASHDGSLLATSVRTTNTAPWMTTIARADDGSQVATIDGFVAQGFSGDGELVVGTYGANRVAIIEWKTGRVIWNATGQYGGFRAEPSGRRLAVGVGFFGGSDQRDVYLVAPDGSALLLPASVHASLRY
jgi:hypothetical protein